MGLENNYGDLPPEYSTLEKAKVVVIPVPFDGTSTWIKGADMGPEALINVSGNMEFYDIETDSEVYKKGIFTEKAISAKTPEELATVLKKKVLEHIEKNRLTIVIGGEHSVSIGAVQAYCEKYKDLSVLQLDAHSDLRDEYQGSKYNHACVMARVKELCPIVQVGIRSMDISEKKNMDKNRVFFAEDIRKDGKWVGMAVKKLSKKVYITIDLDVFDPAIMPSTGTPEPGGLFWYDVLDLLKEVAKKREIVGFDVVELCPNKDNKAPDFMAAKLIYKLLSYKFSEDNQKK